jgi:hypothetical protein
MATDTEVSLPRVLAFEKMSSAQRDLLARWGWGCERIGPDGGKPVTWSMLRPDEQQAIKESWNRDQRVERKHAAEVRASSDQWEKDFVANYAPRAEISEAMTEMAKEAIRFTRDTVQYELSRAVAPLTNEIARLKKEFADLAAGKPQPTSAASVDDKEAMIRFERRLSRHGEHLARLEDRMKKVERG